MADTEALLLRSVNDLGEVADTGAFAAQHGLDHKALVGTIKSLMAHELITSEAIDHSEWVLTKEADSYVAAGASPEVQVFNAVRGGGIPMSQLKASLGPAADVGFKQAMVQKWVGIVKGAEPVVEPKVDSIPGDATLDLLKAVATGGAVGDKDAAALKKRKLVSLSAWKTYKVSKGAKFALEKKKQATDITADMLRDGSWKTQEFKAYNFNTLGTNPEGGYLHPLLKVRAQFRKIFIQMGFEEMPTNNFVESSFWNFDVLFQPQQHPARDAHDTFFLSQPAASDTFPEEYLARVKETHENGGFGSFGYGYDWKRAEAQKNLLRTHTTAVSSRMLYKLAQEGFKPKKYFSVDRVFRNEAIDRTHLAEFHQVEGMICERGLSLGDLVGVLHEFFDRLGMKKLRFKPAFNPYTEPSMEIFAYSEELGKWMEVGNSGMFRPEMLRPMGLPEDVTVIAWGLSLERPTMIMYGVDNIRDLFGHKVNLGMVKSNPVCRMGL